MDHSYKVTTSTSENFDRVSSRETGLQKFLSSAQMTIIGIGGPSGTGLFPGSSFAIGFSGPGVLISYAIGAFIALLMMSALAEMTVAHATTGSLGAYAEYYVGPFAGFAVRWAYWFAFVLIVRTEVAAAALYMKFWLPQVPGLYWIIGFSLALILVNADSVNAFGWIEYIFSALKISGIVGFIILGEWLVWEIPSDSGIGIANYTDHGGFLSNGWWGVWIGSVVTFFRYLGLETTAIAAAEALDPTKSVVRAFRSTLVRFVLFYLLTLSLMVAIVPWTEAGIRESPFIKVMAATGVPHAAEITNVFLLIAALSAMNSQLYTTTRMMFILFRAGYAPSVFGKFNRAGVPTAALSMSILGIGVAALVYALYGDSAFVVMMPISISGAMFAWLIIFITHLCFRNRYKGKLDFKIPLHPTGSIAGGILLVSIYFGYRA